jgi:hypothetical protein
MKSASEFSVVCDKNMTKKQIAPVEAGEYERK